MFWLRNKKIYFQLGILNKRPEYNMEVNSLILHTPLTIGVRLKDKIIYVIEIMQLSIFF